MSFIKNSNINYNEAMVLQFAIQKVIPHFETVAQDAKADRKQRCEDNIAAAHEMLSDIEVMLQNANLKK